MAVPRKKMSRSRIGMRRSGHKLQTVTWIEDKKSGELRRPHHVVEIVSPSMCGSGIVTVRKAFNTAATSMSSCNKAPPTGGNLPQAASAIPAQLTAIPAQSVL